MAIKSIVIALIDRLAAYAAREAENESPEERQRQEEEAAKRLIGEVKRQREKAKALEGSAAAAKNQEQEALSRPAAAEGWGDELVHNGVAALEIVDDGKIDGVTPTIPEQMVRKFRGIPEDVKLFEVFWHQIVELIKVSLLLPLDLVHPRTDSRIHDSRPALISLFKISQRSSSRSSIFRCRAIQKSWNMSIKCSTLPRPRSKNMPTRPTSIIRRRPKIYTLSCYRPSLLTSLSSLS